MVNYVIMLASMLLVIMQGACAMDNGKNGTVTVTCPTPAKPVSIIAWLFSGMWEQQSSKEGEMKAHDAQLMVEVPGRVAMPEEIVLSHAEMQEVGKRRPPTPYYAYPGGPPLPSPEPAKTERCALKLSREWFPCGK